MVYNLHNIHGLYNDKFYTVLHILTEYTMVCKWKSVIVQ